MSDKVVRVAADWMADEIERLRAEVKRLEAENKRLRAALIKALEK